MPPQSKRVHIHVWLGFLAIAHVVADGGDDFSNNLFSDLSPLLALFGERVTMQFMSDSMGWADNIILAMAPLGIITIIISAIRVGGPSWLKAIIGRARENLAAAEVELMSSTSDEVCELWNGREVVRCMGATPVVEFICLLPKEKPTSSEPGKFGVEIRRMDEVLDEIGIQEESSSIRATQARNSNIDVESGAASLQSGASSLQSGSSSQMSEASPQKISITRNLDSGSPNVSINTHGQSTSSELVFGAIIGTTLQLGVLVYACFATYHPSLKFTKDDKSVADYAFPCTTAGTLLLVFGLALCAHVVESSTKERTFRSKDDRRIRVIYLQQQKVVSDQTFKSCAIYGKDDWAFFKSSRRHPRHEIGYDPGDLLQEVTIPSAMKVIGNRLKEFWSRLSRRQEMPQGSRNNQKNPDSDDELRMIQAILAMKTILGTFVTLSGFILQFIGLRGMHWSISIAQLGAVFAMVLIKAWVRRRLARPTEARDLFPSYEIDWLAKTLDEDEHTHYNHLGGKAQEQGNLPEWIILYGKMTNQDDTRSHGRTTGRSTELDGLISSPGVPRLSVDGPKESPVPRLPTSYDANPEHDACGPKAEAPKSRGRAQAILDVRNGLGSLAGWHGLAYDEAVSLSKAIEATMNALVGFKDYQETWEWHALVSCRGVEEHVTLHINRQGGSWSADISEIDAMLSLWLSSIAEDRHKAEGFVKFSVDGPGASIGDDNRSAENGKAMQSRPHDYAVQMIRSLGTSTTSLNRHLRWWIPRDLLHVFECEADDPDLLEAGSTNHSPAKGGSTPPIEPSTKLLATVHRGSLATLCAQKLFSIFMLAVAERMDDPDDWVVDELQSGTAFDDGDWLDIKLRNNTVSRIVQDIHATGLGNTGEIYASIIASLNQYERLPRVDKVVEWVRDHADRYARLEDLEKTQTMLEWLSQIVETPTLIARVEGILMDHLRRILLTIEFWKEQEYNEENRSTDSLAGLRVIVNKGLRKLRQLRRILKGKQAPKEDLADDEFSGLVKLLDQKTCGRTQGLLSTAMLCDIETEASSSERGYVCPLPVQVGYAETFRLTVDHYEAMHCLKHHIIIPGLSTLGYDNRKRAQLFNTKDILDRTPAHYATMIKTPFYIKSLKENGADLNTQDLLGWAPLHYACWACQSENVASLVQGGVALDLQTNDGSTPLHYAVTEGCIEAVRLLLEAGASVDMRDFRGNTPIHLAAFRGYADIVSILLNNASRNLRDRFGRTSLHQAALIGHKDIVEPLFRAGIFLDARDRNGQTSLSIAAKNGHADFVEALIGSGADIETEDEHKKTPLHRAAESGQGECVGVLLAHDASMESKDSKDMTPLHLAAKSGQLDCVQNLLDKGADVTSINCFGETPLHLAAESGTLDVVEALLDKGSDLNLVAHWSGCTPLMLAAGAGQLEVLQILTDDETDFDLENGNGMTVLETAILGKKPDVIPAVIERLIKLGANLEAQVRQGNTLLISAVSELRRNIALPAVEQLVEHGADVEVTGSNGETILQIASGRGLQDVVDYFDRILKQRAK